MDRHVWKGGVVPRAMIRYIGRPSCRLYLGAIGFADVYVEFTIDLEAEDSCEMSVRLRSVIRGEGGGKMCQAPRIRG